jgi:hypothetical protein
MFSIFVAKDDIKKSTIKFGSWDIAGIQNGTKMTAFRSRDANSYDLNLLSIKLGDTLLNNVNRYAKIDPYYPMIYIPTLDFYNLQTRLVAIYGVDMDCTN